jgi:hypothetical protein
VTSGKLLRLGPWALVPVALALTSCGSGSGSGTGMVSPAPSASPDAKLKTAGVTVLTQVGTYQSTSRGCAAQATPVVCLEAADRKLGGQIHSYANVLAVGHGFTPPLADLTAARNKAQTLANSLEILGDAQPTQANYDQVRNTFNVNAALGQLQGAVRTVNDTLGR